MTCATPSPSQVQQGSVRKLINRAVVYAFMPHAGASPGRQASLFQQAMSSVSRGIDNAVARLRPDRQAMIGTESSLAMARNYVRHGIYVAGVLVVYLPSIAAILLCAALNKHLDRGSERYYSGCTFSQRRLPPPSQQQQPQPQPRPQSPLTQHASAGSILLQNGTVSLNTKRQRHLLLAGTLNNVSQLIEPGSSSAGHQLEQCPICLDCVGPTHPIRILACQHSFHAECIDTWLTTCCALCPMCKADLRALAS